MKIHKKNLWRFSGSLTLILSVSACQNHVIATPSAVELPTQFQYTNGSSDVQKWWQNWQDPVLNQLIEQGLTHNFDVKIAQSKLNEARATAQLAHADLKPQVGLTGQTSWAKGKVDNPISEPARNALSRIPQTENLSGSNIDLDSNINALGIAASWEADFFGRKRSDADAAKAAALGAQEQFYGAQLLTASQIAEHYFQIRALQTQQKHLSGSLNALQEMLRYVQARFQTGHATQYDVNEIQTALSSIRAKQATLSAQTDVQIRALAILSGNAPQNFRLPESQSDILNNPPPAPKGILPSELLSRRPDLRARAAAVQARAAKLASAQADLYPRFSIQFLGQGLKIGVLGENALSGWGSLLSVGMNVPLFTAGRIKHNIAAADARLQTALLEYDQNILQALGDVDNAYQMNQALVSQTHLLQQAHQQHQKQSQAAEQLYRYGDKTRDAVLKAQLAQHEAAEKLTQAQLAQAQSVLAMYKALGGGW